jgi:hypothetical protein
MRTKAYPEGTAFCASLKASRVFIFELEYGIRIRT